MKIVRFSGPNKPLLLIIAFKKEVHRKQGITRHQVHKDIATGGIRDSMSITRAVVAYDTEGGVRLARYLIRPPVSLERLTYDRKNQQVFYKRFPQGREKAKEADKSRGVSPVPGGKTDKAAQNRKISPIPTADRP